MKHRAAVSGHTAATKTQRTSKTSQKLVVLPSAPQTRPLVPSDEEDLTLGVETHDGVREYKSEAERMNKEQRRQAGYKRLTAYCVAESFKMKLLASYLKREHNVGPRIFDEALYAVSCVVSLILRFLIYDEEFERCIIFRCCLVMDQV